MKTRRQERDGGIRVILPHPASISLVGLMSVLRDTFNMQTVTLLEAQKHLVELIRQLPRQGEFLIVDAEKPVARLSSMAAQTSLRQLEPQSVGAVLRPFPAPDDDTLGEMVDPQQ
jgi:antitoxin (DNA-binding transcriptional repressor) of toxin-antitoxin stability system